ncbi:carbohydrate binding family 9 domain-containing protein [Candidatus Fermentibacteria bacterium]|nr:carbohydrate binding family 9 domain-containing protein [Candidatus Fermentibacteria bacterium]
MNTTLLVAVAVPCLLFGIASPASALRGFAPHGMGPGYPDCANGRKTTPPSLPACRITNGGVYIDGYLTEEDWVSAPAATGFTQFEPDRRGEPSEDTVFKVLYDDDALYVGVACFRSNGAPVTSCLSRRDHITSSDLIRVYLSPYHDMVTGYHFRINPDGVMEDYYNYGDLFHDVSWNGVWQADTHVDDHGWYAEMRIPFSILRYRPSESMTWGFNVFQHIMSCGERTAWSNWGRDQQGFMSRSGTITGIAGIRAPRQLEIMPYTVASLTDPSIVGEGDELTTYGNIGADLKYGVTADLTLNATLQPDFGQVEADPSLLNLSPYETFYEEKRPFFVEGAQFFFHPDFTVFYSRRIGTGSEYSRIRYAGKITGKTAGNISTAVLVAATDEAGEGRSHNPFRAGVHRAHYAIGRFGKQFHRGMHHLNLMQTAVVRDADTFDGMTRNGYTTGADFELNFRDRMYQATGSFVGSVVDILRDPANPSVDPAPSYGTGSRLEFEKMSGNWRFALTTRHQSDELDINDLGYINNPNHKAVQGWISRVFNADDEKSFITNASLQLRYYRSWVWAGRHVVHHEDSSRTLWSYDRGHGLLSSLNFEASLDARNCWGAWCGMTYNDDYTDLFSTRRAVDGGQGPLMSRPREHLAWAGFYTDSRKNLQMNVSIQQGGDRAGGRELTLESSASWIQNSRMNHTLSGRFSRRHVDAQWIGNFANPGGGIGGTSYVFAALDQRLWNLTVRSSLQFSRDASIELYLQPFLTVGSYANARELALPDTYDFATYPYDASSHDFSYGAVNLNMVYRWEYAPGATVYLVWTHTRDRFDSRGNPASNGGFDNGFGTRPLFDNEPENRVMLKVSYWFSL